MTGFEPATFGATSRRSNRLSYTLHERRILSLTNRIVKAERGFAAPRLVLNASDLL